MKIVIMAFAAVCLAVTSCDTEGGSQPKQKAVTEIHEMKTFTVNLVAQLDSIWIAEQGPLRKRDAMFKKYGADSEQYAKYQAIYEKNHIVNEAKIKAILADGWPELQVIGDMGNRTICNVLQHSDYETRMAYLPLMKQAVNDGQLSAQLLVRAEDRLATDRGELQIYGGQMKYDPETKSLKLWPVLDPENIDKRRAEVGLGPIAEFLKMRFDYEWNLEEELQRTEAFVKAKEKAALKSN